MVKVCPTCGGKQIGCPTCNAPPKRVLPKGDIYKGKMEYRKMMALNAQLYGAPVWEVQAVDLSVWNGQMDFMVTRTKVQCVILRYGYGNSWQDAKLAEYHAQATAADMPIGAYWYCRPWEDPLQHAASFAELLRRYPVKLEESGDFEGDPHGKTKVQVYNWIVAFEESLKAQTNKWQMPYSSAGFWNSYVQTSTRWTNRKVYPANWTVRDYPTVPIGWTFKQGDYWQWQADGNNKAREYGMVSGGDADMDLDRIYNTVEQFNIDYGTHIKHIGEPQPPPPPPGQVPETVIITTGELAIHDTPYLYQTNIVGHALINTQWHPFEEVYINGVKLYRVTKDGYISKAYTRLP